MTHKTASQTTRTPISLSEVELSVRWNKSPRSLFNWRKAGEMPAHFKARTAGRYPQVRYLLVEIEAYEQLLAQ